MMGHSLWSRGDGWEGWTGDPLFAAIPKRLMAELSPGMPTAERYGASCSRPASGRWFVQPAPRSRRDEFVRSEGASEVSARALLCVEETVLASMAIYLYLAINVTVIAYRNNIANIAQVRLGILVISKIKNNAVLLEKLTVLMAGDHASSCVLM